MADLLRVLLADEEGFAGSVDDLGCQVGELFRVWMRSIWVTRRSTSRKLPPVMGTTVAIAVAWAIPSSVAFALLGRRRVRTAVSSSGVSGRYSWAKPIAAVLLRVSDETFFDAGHADRDDAHVVPVEEVADSLKAGRF